MRISKVIFICCFLLPFLASCTRDEIEDNSYPLAEYDGTGVLFRLKAEAFDDTGSATRTVDLTAPFDTLCAYVLKEGQIDIDREVKFPDPATIMVEGLETGTYNLLILAMKGNYKEDGARIHKIEKSSSPWLSFPENTPAKPLKAQYYYTNHKFSVINGKIKIEEIRIFQAVGLVSFDIQYKSDYVRKSVHDCHFIPSEDSRSYSALHADGSHSGQRSIASFSLSEQKQCLFFPTVKDGFSGQVVVNTMNHRKESFDTEYDAKATLDAARHSTIHVQAVHPEDNVGTNLADELTPLNYYTILSDEEPASVYTNANLRSFYITQPLQINMENDSLHMRFYSPVGIKEVTVMAKSPTMDEYVEFVYIDDIPAFADIKTSIKVLEKGLYRTESGKVLQFSAEEMNPASLSLKIACNDPYWTKISQIKAKWYIKFVLNGGNPVTGTPNKNWWGIRPVHCREAVALFLNIGYMCTLEKFQQRVSTFQGTFLDNNRYPVDTSTLISRLENLSGFDIGLIYSGNGVSGLGGGRTWGVYQKSFLYHYENSGGCCSTIFHELGHCLGYNHNSTMTYGQWASGCADVFYKNNIKDFPVNSHTILKSRSNPNIY